jgi:hypothetical protein
MEDKYPKFIEHHAFNTHIKFNMPQRLLLFPNNKQKKFEMQKKWIMIILVLNANIVTRPKNSNC